MPAIADVSPSASSSESRKGYAGYAGLIHARFSATHGRRSAIRATLSTFLQVCVSFFFVLAQAVRVNSGPSDEGKVFENF
jgi:hypothetical protein